MNTYPIFDDNNMLVAFEIDNSMITLGILKKILSRIDGVSNIRKRRIFEKSDEWGDIRIKFSYNNVECVVWEPHGDNSRYWIGQMKTKNMVDINDICNTFSDYKPLFSKYIIVLLFLLVFAIGMIIRMKIKC